MKFTDLECCPFCGCEEFYERRSVSGHVIFAMRFDGEETDNSQMYDTINYGGSSRVWCCDCNRYLGNPETGRVGVRAERAYKEQH